MSIFTGHTSEPQSCGVNFLQPNNMFGKTNMETNSPIQYAWFLRNSKTKTLLVLCFFNIPYWLEVLKTERVKSKLWPCVVHRWAVPRLRVSTITFHGQLLPFLGLSYSFTDFMAFDRKFSLCFLWRLPKMEMSFFFFQNLLLFLFVIVFIYLEVTCHKYYYWIKRHSHVLFI